MSAPSAAQSPTGRGVIDHSEYYIDKRDDGGTYDFTAQQYQDFVCAHTNISFYQNPQALNPDSPEFSKYDTRIYLACSAFETGGQIVAHFYLPGLASDAKWTDRQLFLNRTEFSQAYFATTYEKELEFTAVEKAQMYYGINMRKGPITVEDLDAFVLDAKTTKLFETRSQVITEEYMDPIKLKAVTKTNIRFGLVPTLTILSYPLLFEDLNGTEIAMTPLDDLINSYRVKTEPATTNIAHIEISFTEEIWTYKYY